MKTKIDTLLFDFGGVLFHIDYEAPVKAFAALGIPNFTQIFSKQQQNNLIDAYEIGMISTDAFIAALQDLAGNNLPVSSIMRAWNAILLGMPPQFVNMLYSLAQNYKLILLSNTNAMHVEKFNEILNNDLEGFQLEDVFEHVFYSHILHMRKPNRATFEAVIELGHIDPCKTLYIEDSPQHIATAKQLGFYTIHHTTNNLDLSAIKSFIPQLRT